MARPSITLCLIAKDEESNLPRLLESVKDCFDEIHLTDTGSKDKTVEIAKRYGCKTFHFDWIQDFSAARNYSMSHATTDFLMWLDCDDELRYAKDFIDWRDSAMDFGDYWLAQYIYASRNGVPECTFARERVFRRSKQLRWTYPIHEGVMPVSDFGKVIPNFAGNWVVWHMRSEEDLVKDKNRNLKIFESLPNMDSRLTYYYGKELFEADQFEKAVKVLGDAVKLPDLQPHDRVLGLQYLIYSLIKMEDKWGPKVYGDALQIALQGVALMPHRAEFHTLAGDCFIKLGKVAEAIPFYAASKACLKPSSDGPSPIFHHNDVYGPYPRNQLARCYARIGLLDRAQEEATESSEKFGSEEGRLISEEITKMHALQKPSGAKQKCDDIVISANLGYMRNWDYEYYKTQGLGGSETAAVLIARELKKLQPDRRVLIFNPRDKDKVEDGVEYFQQERIGEYFSKYEPHLHVAWRHNLKMTNAKTWAWSHDLQIQGADNHTIFDKYLCLSEFHRKYVLSMNKIPKEKVIVTRNGVDPEIFRDLVIKKQYAKCIFSSSPDRGLDRTIRVLDIVKKDIPELELHVFYGFDGMIKMGHHDEVSKYQSMIAQRPWIKYHGNTKKPDLMRHFATSQVWVYPTWFMETSCITALEALATKVYPVVRRVGALGDTLGHAEKNGMATLLDINCETESQYEQYASETIKAIKENKWERVSLDLQEHSWESVARDWLKLNGVLI